MMVWEGVRLSSTALRELLNVDVAKRLSLDKHGGSRQGRRDGSILKRASPRNNVASSLSLASHHLEKTERAFRAFTPPSLNSRWREFVPIFLPMDRVQTRLAT